MTMTIEPNSGPLLLFGGPYSNLAATAAIQQAAEAHDLPPHNCICTGDVVAYCAHPEETVHRIRDWGISVVMGNCEESLGNSADDCGCGFDEGSVCSALSMDWYRYADRQISQSTRAWMRELPRQIGFHLGGRDFMVVHGSVTQINRFIFASTPRQDKQVELDAAGVDCVIGGHAGLPFGARVDHRTWLNAGVIGLPANDATPDGWYLMLTPDDTGVTASWHRLAYDARTESAVMMQHGLKGYADTLMTGLWPSIDVLPDQERARRGIPLAPEPMHL